MVVWCVKERESVNLFQRFRAVFYRLPRLVRGWPASQVRAGFSPVNACFCVNTVGGGGEVLLNVLRCQLTLLGTSCDQCRSMVQ